MGIGEGAGGLLGGIFGGIAAGPDRGHQQALLDEAIAAIQGVKTPDDLAKQIYFQQYQNAGQLTPAQEQSILSGPSAESQVKANPELIKAQMQALGALKGVSQTGMTSADKARLNQIQQQMQTQEQGQRQQIMQNFAQRGLAGSGNELLAQLTNAQNSANQGNQQGLNVAANAQQNALNALGQYGGMAGQMNQQQFGQQAQTAQAADLMNRFNTQNQLGQQQRNVQNQNMANQYNLQNKQGLMNQNTGLNNQGLLLQRQGEQQQFEDAMQKGQALSGAQFKGAGAYGDLANQIASNWSNTGKGVGGLFDQFGGQSAGGGSQNTMGTNKQSGGITQGSADILSNYDFGEPLAYGGEVQHYDQGGIVEDVEKLAPLAMMLMAKGGSVPYSFGGHVPASEDAHVRTYGNGFDAPNNYHDGGYLTPNVPYAQGGTTGHTYLTPAMCHALMRNGGKVPGEASVPGNSYENDTVHARLSPGEIVIPRNILESPRAGDLAKHFVEGELEKHSRK